MSVLTTITAKIKALGTKRTPRTPPPPRPADSSGGR